MRRLIRLLTIAALASTSAAAIAADSTAPAAPKPLERSKPIAAEDLPAATYEILTKETLVRYTVDHLGFNDYWGTFAGSTGTLTLDPKNIGATKVDVTIPIYQLETTDRELDIDLFSDGFFNEVRFPEMHFVSTEVKRTGPDTALLTGNLTIRDVTKPLTLDVTFHGAGLDPFGGGDLDIGFDAKGTVKRSDYGLGKWVPIVSDETRIFISAELKKR